MKKKILRFTIRAFALIVAIAFCTISIWCGILGIFCWGELNYVLGYWGAAIAFHIIYLFFLGFFMETSPKKNK